MAKKCANCNKVYDDNTIYCPNCGGKTQEVREVQKPQNNGGSMMNNIDWRALFQKVFIEYGMVTGAVLALIWSWNWDILFGTAISIGVLITPFVDKSREYKALGISRVVAVINIILGIISW